ncbi:MAG: putative membrane protein, partial [Flavobacterium sp.]
MIVTIKNNIVHYYLKIVRSIGFYPFLITIGFLVLSYFSLLFDFSEIGLNIKKSSFWISLKDAETTRTIISTITSGVISLTVFSFSMVMIVLNQTASQMSNRILDKLIGSRFQQFVLGLYLGTIVYALFLLSSIRDLDSGIQIPAISTYFLIFLTIVDLFVFIYFLHFITQSVKYETIIKRIYIETLASLEKFVFNNKAENLTNIPNQEVFAIKMLVKVPKSGVYLGFRLDELIAFCDKNDCLL